MLKNKRQSVRMLEHQSDMSSIIGVTIVSFRIWLRAGRRAVGIKNQFSSNDRTELMPKAGDDSKRER